MDKATRKASYPYLHRVVNRHGKICYYYWRRPGAKIRIRGEPGSTEFKENYWRAVDGKTAISKQELMQKEVAGVRISMRHNRDAPKETMPTKQKVAFAVERAVIRARKRATERKMACDINFEWAMARVVEAGHKCEMTGIAFFDPSGDGHRTHPYTPSIDRIDSTLGYTQANCRVVCCAFNVAMNEWGADVFETVSGAFQKRVKALSG